MPAVQAILLLAGFLADLALRLVIGGGQPAASAAAGLVFAAGLLGLSLAAGTKAILSKKSAATGIYGAAVLAVPVWLWGGPAGQHQPYGSFAAWLAVVAVVAVAEEALLRGALYDRLSQWRGARLAVLAAAALFALLHVPLYGWHVVPLDFVVGIWLGCLRAYSGSFVSPAIAHTAADAAGWWLR